MPTVAVSPISDAQFFDNNGDPLNGGKLFYYVGGSFTVQKTTYSTSAGTTPNPNPIVLNSSGRPTATAFLVVNEPYNIQLTAADGTTVLNSWVNVSVATGGGGVSGVSQILAGTNVTISPLSGTGTVTINASGGATPGEPNQSIQYNNTGTLAGTSTFLFDDASNTITFLGGPATIANPVGSILLAPSVEGGYAVVGQSGSNGILEGTGGANLTIRSDQQLILETINNGILVALNDTSTKVSITGPSASDYASGLGNNDLVNKYYVDNAGGGGGGVTQIIAGTNVTISPLSGTGTVTINATGGGGGGGGTSTLNIITTSTNYTTTLASNQAMIVLDAPSSTITTVTIDSSLAYPVGTTISFWNNSIYDMNIALSTGIMIQVQTGLTGTRTLTGYGMATAVKIKSAGLWTINGAGLL